MLRRLSASKQANGSRDRKKILGDGLIVSLEDCKTCCRVLDSSKRVKRFTLCEKNVQKSQGATHAHSRRVGSRSLSLADRSPLLGV